MDLETLDTVTSGVADASRTAAFVPASVSVSMCVEEPPVQLPYRLMDGTAPTLFVMNNAVYVFALHRFSCLSTCLSFFSHNSGCF